MPGAAPTAAPLRSGHPAPLRSHARGEGGTAGRTGARPLPAQPCRPRRSRPALTWQPAPPFQTRPPPLRPLPALAAAATGERRRQSLDAAGRFPGEVGPARGRGDAVQYRPVPTAAATWPSGACAAPPPRRDPAGARARPRSGTSCAARSSSFREQQRSKASLRRPHFNSELRFLFTVI